MFPELLSSLSCSPLLLFPCAEHRTRLSELGGIDIEEARRRPSTGLTPDCQHARKSGRGSALRSPSDCMCLRAVMSQFVRWERTDHAGSASLLCAGSLLISLLVLSVTARVARSWTLNSEHYGMLGLEHVIGHGFLALLPVAIHLSGLCCDSAIGNLDLAFTRVCALHGRTLTPRSRSRTLGPSPAHAGTTNHRQGTAHHHEPRTANH